MVGHHHIDYSITKTLPQLLAVVAAANRRRTFRKRGTVRNSFGGQVQIMWTGFHSDGKASGACGLQLPKGHAGSEMNDVQTKAVFAAKRQQEPDRRQLRFIRPRLQICFVAPPIGAGQFFGGRIDRTRNLGVY